METETKPTYRTADRVTLREGDHAYDYYSMKPGVIGRASTGFADPDPWFDFIHDDGTTALLNGERICTDGHARHMGWPNA